MTAEETGEWDYKPDGQTTTQPNLGSRSNPKEQAAKTPSKATSVEWTASEYIDHSRGASWYLLLTVVTIVVTAVVYLITRDVFATGVTVAVGIVIWVFSLNKPKEVRYQLSADGFAAGEKQYSYNQFKSFAIIREGGLLSLNLVPTKKFTPVISAYFSPADEDKIVSVMGQHLPYEERGLDGVERLTRRLRF